MCFSLPSIWIEEGNTQIEEENRCIKERNTQFLRGNT